ncbi:MAG: hypothetical protein AB8G11_01740 [Saprospiraceae bacterium]
MFEDKDYSKLTLEELQAEAKRIKNHELFSAGFIGLLIGIMIYGVAMNGFGILYIAIPLLLISGMVKGSQSLKVKLKEIEGLIKEKS